MLDKQTGYLGRFFRGRCRLWRDVVVGFGSMQEQIESAEITGGDSLTAFRLHEIYQGAKVLNLIGEKFRGGTPASSLGQGREEFADIRLQAGMFSGEE